MQFSNVNTTSLQLVLQLPTYYQYSLDELLQVHVSKNLASLLVLLLFKMLEWKVAKLFPVVAKKVAKASFYINRDLVKNSPNIRKMCGLLL